MPDTAIQELVERLNEAYCQSLGSHQDRKFLTEAAQALTTLSRQIEEVREALTRIADGKSPDIEFYRHSAKVALKKLPLPGVSTNGV